ncbi:MAG: peptide/nickel transport system substrate-binding protein [Acidimicrobiaceae bacterium]|nr:peptide/nickel transport system substrate-binding protein [Acidimicrobiaceae bacterium]
MTGLRGRGLLLSVVAIGMVAVSCSKSSSTSTSPTTSANGPTTTVAAKQGGDITLGAEQEPDCMDWIGSCAGAAWGVYTVQTNTMPRAYDYTDSGYKANSLLTGAADLVTTPKQVVTYHINPAAVWDDNSPITAHDFKYTWDQIAHGKDIYDQSGYNQIASVDDTDPHTAVVTFSTPYPDWRALFGGFYGIFPSHLLEGKDRDALMKDGYSFSAGPYKIDHWTKGSEVKLVPNPNFWGKKSNLASVTFKFITDTAAEQQDYKSGQILASYPQAQPGGEALKGSPGTYFDAISGLSYEALWFNVEKAPLDSKAVRQALGFATDRNAIVQQLFAPIQPDIKPIQSMFTPAFGAAYSTPYSKYTLQLSMVDTLMKGDGWAKGSDGIWAKGGTKATLELKTTTGNKRRQLTAQILQTQWQAAGFGLTITPEKAGVLFGQDLPSGNFQIGLYAQTPADNDPGQCVIWCSKNIPTQANGNSGQNWDRINDPNLDKPWLDADTNLDDNARVADAQQGSTILSDLVPALPLDPFPDILVINSDKLGSQQGSFQHNFAYGPFTYLNYWFLK